jgi:type II secretory pathway pseudopilin PulG
MAVLITILNIAVAAVLPLASTAIQREREEELIFRGLQYAEAIRVFQQRFGRLPVRLEELIKTEPRCIRQLWVDPMTGEADWGLIIETGRGGANVGRPGGRPGGRPRPQPEEEPSGGPTLGQPPKLPTGPIKGVHSRSKGDAIKVFFGREKYEDWQFTVDLVLAPEGLGGLDPMPRINARWIGRPFRVSPPGQGQPGGTGLPPSDMTTSPGPDGRPGTRPGGRPGGSRPRPGSSPRGSGGG